MKADSWLASALAAGPRLSRDVRELAERAGITDKALRGARLRLGLVVTRAGNGRSMQSTWALPTSAAALERGAPPVRRGLDDDEIRRHGARVAYFTRRGLDPTSASQAATALVERDRSMSREWGSCAECQRFYWRDCGGARPPEEVHPCWLRRSDAP